MHDTGSHWHLEARQVSRRFESLPTVGERIAGWVGLGADRRAVQAVDGADLRVQRGEVLGLVGESGCGKSTLGRMLAGSMSPSDGEVLLAGMPVMHDGRKATARVQMIFQDPFASLDPRMRVGEALAEGPLTHALVTRAQAPAYVEHWLQRVGLPAEAAQRVPHQFSGGQRQRIAIARALAMQPDTLVCDEPVASLDVSIQAQVLNLFMDLRRELSLTMVFISHHLGVVRHLCDRVAVMYLGRIVEVAPAAELYAQPRHPYTQALLDSVPRLDLQDADGNDSTSGSEPDAWQGPAVSLPKPIRGELPSPLNPPPGCHFHQRCPLAQARCAQEVPGTETSGPGRTVACHRWREV